MKTKFDNVRERKGEKCKSPLLVNFGTNQSSSSLISVTRHLADKVSIKIRNFGAK